MSAPDATRSADDLWQIVYARLEHPRKAKDHSANAVLNRLVNERFPSGPPLELNQTTCSIGEHEYSTRELEAFERWHKRDTPASDAGSIVVAQCRGRSFVIDGNNRVNRWIRENSRDLHRAIVIYCERLDG
jgi:hypothetical protein